MIIVGGVGASGANDDVLAVGRHCRTAMIVISFGNLPALGFPIEDRCPGDRSDEHLPATVAEITLTIMAVMKAGNHLNFIGLLVFFVFILGVFPMDLVS